ncbi:tripartite tricarboxylate transporter substrate binding protein [Roseomonas frigidaquae]|uniref:Tripartite tricarboxylate transporter substrate binding protein n=1 Tax=Falsiroseomonas frigidaquae TaxID=487318 RepID=A0ABX1F2G5_9PROT|nr:tripartite tricarboxylate transporter substrate-binding protein [Falsiroseomonas frigidaquae]NKE46524.1 tripartite tricarboxylate transporter substrate binding protein [Falsiroseomonas frigidaquae]
MVQLSRRSALLLPMAGLAIGRAAPAGAQSSYPSRPVSVIVPFAPSGGADVVARIVFAQAGSEDGPGFVIENRPGAGGNIGAQTLARATPDGHTIGTIAISTHGVNPTLYRRLPFDPLADFTPIALLSLQPVVVAVRTESPIRTMEEFVARKGDDLTYASAGNGTSGHMAGELLRMKAGMKMLHVPYRGSGPAWADVLGGRVDAVIDNVQAGLPHHAGGRVRILGISSAEKLEVLPDVAPIARTLPGYLVNSWNGMAGPANLPPAVVQRLSAMATAWLAKPELKARYRDLGILVPPDTSPGYLADFIRQEIAMWAPVVREAGMQVD